MPDSSRKRDNAEPYKWMVGATPIIKLAGYKATVIDPTDRERVVAEGWTCRGGMGVSRKGDGTAPYYECPHEHATQAEAHSCARAAWK